MSTKLEQLKELLKKDNLWAKKSLGQNFLIDEIALNSIIEAADLQPNDQIIEVGPGTGFLTEKLIEKAKQVTAVEYDEDMVHVLNGRFQKVKNLEIIHSDILKFNIENWTLGIGNCHYKVVANIPYYITSPLIKLFLQAKKRPSTMVLLVQKEVAEKICGITGKSLITIETQLFGDPEIIMEVPSKSFHPAPKVDSAILKIKVHDQPLVAENELKDFLRIVKFGYSQKRKKLCNTLSAGLRIKPAVIKSILEDMGINTDIRAEKLDISDWKDLLKLLQAQH